MDRAREIADLLEPHHRDLLLGKCSGWCSWMWSAGNHMVSLGLGTRRAGDIQFDTPLATEVIAILKEQDDGK